MILLSDRPGTPQDKMDAASGGHVEHPEIGVLLNKGNGPQQQELLRVIGALSGTDKHGEPSTHSRL